MSSPCGAAASAVGTTNKAAGASASTLINTGSNSLAHGVAPSVTAASNRSKSNLPIHRLMASATATMGMADSRSTPSTTDAVTDSRSTQQQEVAGNVQNLRENLAVLDSSLRRDFLSKRYWAFQHEQSFQPDATRSHTTDTGRLLRSASDDLSAHQLLAVTTVGSDSPNKQQEIVDRTAESQFWCGASWLERALASCCVCPGINEMEADQDSMEQDSLDSEQPYFEDIIALPGSLDRNKIWKFLRLLTFHCYDLDSRALVLAILERTQEADEQEELALRHHVIQQKILLGIPVDEEVNSTSSIVASKPTEPSPAKKARVEKSVSPIASFDMTPPSPFMDTLSEKKWSSRIMDFLQLGGLKIISQWLVDASTAESSSNTMKSKDSTDVVNETSVSPTGPLLLPLLLFLCKLPFDHNIITESKINKHIRKLSKQIDALVTQRMNEQEGERPECNSSEETTHCTMDQSHSAGLDLSQWKHPIAGGLPVLRIQEVLQDLKKTWVSHSKRQMQEKKQIGYKDIETATSKPLASFRKLQSLFQDRLRTLSDDVGNELVDNDDKPTWLVQLRAIQVEQDGTKRNGLLTSNQKRSSTKQLAQKERDNERSAMMKKDLEKAQEERRALLRKLRKLKSQQQTKQNNGAAASFNSGGRILARKGVQWKDGLGAASTIRDRGKLEEVFTFHKDRHASARIKDGTFMVSTLSSGTTARNNAMNATPGSAQGGPGQSSPEARTLRLADQKKTTELIDFEEQEEEDLLFETPN